MAKAQSTETFTANRSTIIVAHEDARYAAGVCSHFRQLGWQTCEAATVADARKLSRTVGPCVLVMSVDFPGESGWLTCAKLMHEHPQLKVILVADQWTPANGRFAAFVGSAALVEKNSGVRGVIEQVYRVTDLPAAG